MNTETTKTTFKGFLIEADRNDEGDYGFSVYQANRIFARKLSGFTTVRAAEKAARQAIRNAPSA